MSAGDLRSAHRAIPAPTHSGSGLPLPTRGDQAASDPCVPGRENLRKSGRGDLLAGVTVATLALPSGIAYAELTGLPVVAGIYALLLPTAAYALF